MASLLFEGGKQEQEEEERERERAKNVEEGRIGKFAPFRNCLENCSFYRPFLLLIHTQKERERDERRGKIVSFPFLKTIRKLAFSESASACANECRTEKCIKTEAAGEKEPVIY